MRVLGIDPNTKNWLACVSNIGKSFIVDGGRVRFWNQKRNKFIAKLKEGKDQNYWDDQCQNQFKIQNSKLLNVFLFSGGKINSSSGGLYPELINSKFTLYFEFLMQEF